MSKAPRYPRSFGGMVGSMIVLVAAVVAFTVFRGIFRDDPSDDLVGSAVDWQTNVEAVQTVATIAWPRELPDGWTVTSADWDRADPDRPLWRVGMVTGDGEEFVGLYQQDASTDDLVEATIGDDADRDDEIVIESEVASDWTRWTASGGDIAFSTVLDPDTAEETSLVVYGTDQADVSELLVSLTTDPIRAN
ncbi:MAG: DUF4245 family protein [Nocardioides sp.]